MIIKKLLIAFLCGCALGSLISIVPDYGTIINFTIDFTVFFVFGYFIIKFLGIKDQ